MLLSCGGSVSRLWITRTRSRWKNGGSVGVRAVHAKAKEEWQIQVDMEHGPPLRLGFGKLAKMADGACVATMGATSVLTTSVCPSAAESSSPSAIPSFVPLTVDYKQKAAAAGRIPTTHLRREMGVSEKETLTSRMIDRSVRPLFPKTFGLETQVVCNLLSVDSAFEPDVLAINAASAALATSDIPWNGPVGAVRVGYVGGDVVVNPTRREMADSALNLVVTGTADKRAIMLEAEANNLDLPLFVDGVKTGLEACASIASNIVRAVEERGVTKRRLPAVAQVPDQVFADLELICRLKLEAVLSDATLDKAGRHNAMFGIRDEAVTALRGTHSEVDPSVFYFCFSRLCREIIAEKAIRQQRRVDGRDLESLRPISCETDLHAPLHGSALFQRGQTQVFCTVALDSVESALKADSLSSAKKNFFLHYEFPPYATNEIGKTGVGRREIGHGALAEKGLRAVVPKNYPFTIRLTSEVMESNGSSSMASICGGSLALLDAGVPLSASAAGVAVGLVTREQTEAKSDKDVEYAILLDILGLEDFLGDMDFKIAGTRSGVTALQADVKLAGGLPMEVVRRASSLGHKGINRILDIMESRIKEPRRDKTNLPVTEKLVVPAHKRAQFVGPGGVNLKLLTSEIGVQVTASASDAGEFVMFAPNKEAMAEAKERVEELLADEEMVPEYEFGAILEVTVVELKERGVNVEMHPSLPSVFIPVSQLAANKVVHPSALGLKVGGKIQVKHYGRDPVTGAVRLSRKSLVVASSSAVKRLNKSARSSPPPPPPTFPSPRPSFSPSSPPPPSQPVIFSPHGDSTVVGDQTLSSILRTLSLRPSPRAKRDALRVATEGKFSGKVKELGTAGQDRITNVQVKNAECRNENVLERIEVGSLQEGREDIKTNSEAVEEGTILHQVPEMPKVAPPIIEEGDKLYYEMDSALNRMMATQREVDDARERLQEARDDLAENLDKLNFLDETQAANPILSYSFRSSTFEKIQKGRSKIRAIEETLRNASVRNTEERTAFTDLNSAFINAWHDETQKEYDAKSSYLRVGDVFEVTVADREGSLGVYVSRVSCDMTFFLHRSTFPVGELPKTGANLKLKYLGPDKVSGRDRFSLHTGRTKAVSIDVEHLLTRDQWSHEN